ncbi:complement factor H-related protein 1-like isoform 1-T1 [Lycodopsis pacificus]
MCARGHLGFVLLLWFQGVLHVQTSGQPCSAPTLNGGYLVPEKDTYNHEAKLTYACDNGRKPAVEGWWATSTCLHGTWSPAPECIDENACIAPDIPNAQYTQKSGWYNDGYKIRIKCNEGYDPKGHNVTTTCINGKWSSVPFCEKNIHACGEPPQIPHAVIILQRYQDVFAADTGVQYECEDGYTVEGGDAKKYVYCIAGNWTQGPVCSSGPGTGHGGSGGHDTSADSGTQPDWQVNNCGKHPVVPNGDFVEKNEMFVSYQCTSFYKLVGPDTVECYSNGTWSKEPTCEANFCSVDTNRYYEFINNGVKFLRDGETVKLECVKESHQINDHYSVGRCRNGNISFSECCAEWERKLHMC